MISLDQLQTFLIYCTVFNLLVVSLWFSLFNFAHDSIYKLHLRWFQISVAQFDGLHYTGIMIYKISIYFFNIAPLISLWLMPH
jgi:hypothetical protein